MKIDQISPEDLTNFSLYGKLKEQGESSAPHSFLVSKITEAIRDQSRVNIYLDGKFFCSLGISQLSELKIKVGTKLSLTEAENLKRASDFGKLYVRAQNYALSRPHSAKELHDYLKKTTQDRKIRYKNPKTGLYETKLKAGYDKTLIQPVLDCLTIRGHIDDQKFTEFWVENRKNRQGISQKKLRIELQQKGINPKLIDQALLKSPRNESLEIQKIITKKRHKYDDQKLIQYLLRHGFDFEVAKTAVRGTDSQN